MSASVYSGPSDSPAQRPFTGGSHAPPNAELATADMPDLIEEQRGDLGNCYAVVGGRRLRLGKL
ncbi:MAG: hypothetical protein ACREDR_48470, partial [Blastocatellia bacterium]